MTDRESLISSLPMPAWMTNHGVTDIRYHADTGGNDAFTAKCKRHFTESRWLPDEGAAERWKCPQCVEESRDFERSTRDE